MYQSVTGWYVCIRGVNKAVYQRHTSHTRPNVCRVSPHTRHSTVHTHIHTRHREAQSRTGKWEKQYKYFGSHRTDKLSTDTPQTADCTHTHIRLSAHTDTQTHPSLARAAAPSDLAQWQSRDHAASAQTTPVMQRRPSHRNGHCWPLLCTQASGHCAPTVA